MERPLADKRPIGPFSQSERFSEQLLGGDEGVQTIQEGDALLVEMLGPDVSQAMDFAEQAVVTIDQNEFAELIEIGSADGSRDKVGTDREVEVGILYFAVNAVADPGVTIGQIEQFIEQEVQGSPANVLKVNVVSL